NGNPGGADTAPQWETQMIADGMGGAIVAWRDGRVVSGGAASLYAQSLSSDGVTPARLSLAEPVWDEEAVLIRGAVSGAGSVELWRTDGVAGSLIATLTPDGRGMVSYSD